MSDYLNQLIARGPQVNLGASYVDARLAGTRNALMQQDYQRTQQQDAASAAEEQAWNQAVQARDIETMLQIDPQATQLLQQHWQADRMSGLGEVGVYRKPMEVPQEAIRPNIVQQGGYSYMFDPSKGIIPGSVQAPQRAPMEAPAKPQLVDVPQPDGTTQKQWVYPGQSRGAPVGAPTTTAAAAKPPTEADKKVATLFGSMVTAANNLADLAGADTSSLGNAALDSNPLTRAATSGDYRKYQSAAKQWSANLLYIKSGATATPEEVYSTYQQFFPQPGDTEEVKAQKAAAREQEMRNIQATYPDTTKQYKWKSQSTSPASGAPQIGEVKKGYRYKGGDPASPSSWEKVK